MAHAYDRTYIASLAFGDPDKKNSRHDFACQYLALVDNRVSLIQASIAMLQPDKEAQLAEIRLDENAFLEHPINKGEAQYKTTIGFMDVVSRSETRWAKDELPPAPVPEEEVVDAELTALLDRWAGVIERMESGPVAVLRHAVPLVVSAELIRIGFESGSFYANKLALPESQNTIAKAAERTLGSRPVIEIVQDDFSDDSPTVARREDAKELREKAQKRAESWTQNELLIEVKIAPVGVGDLIRQITLYREYWVARSGRVVWIAATDYPISVEDRTTLRNAGIFHVGLGKKFDAYVKQRLENKRMADSTEI